MDMARYDMWVTRSSRWIRDPTCDGGLPPSVGWQLYNSLVVSQGVFLNAYMVRLAALRSQQDEP
jgi:hypothetical protein